MSAAIAILLLAQPAPDGKVTLPLGSYQQILTAVEAEDAPQLPDDAWGSIRRRIEGRFDKGLLTAVLTAELEVLGDRGHVRVPVVDRRVSLGAVELDGQRTSLLAEGDLYTVGIDRPGRHTLRAEIFVGREQDRYSRRIQLRLPPVGSTAVEVLIPERGIDARLANGALVSSTLTPAGTRLIGHNAGELLDLSWARRLDHRAATAARTEAQLSAVLTVQEAMVTGLAMFEVSVLEGEIDRVSLSVPEGLEITSVEGDTVLQWRNEARASGGGRGGNQLAVLLRYLVHDRVRFGVRFQFPVDPDKPVEARLPSTLEDTALVGALGIQAPAGLDVRVASVAEAEVLSARDVPPELSDLSASPLLHAFRFRASPQISLSVSRHASVELTSTLVDELQASTVLTASGQEITKLKLRIRNNTRQYLTMWLPSGAVLTHSLIDGQPTRPAIAPGGEADAEALLIPLRQSERIGAGRERTHRVREGETLSDLANLYYSDPTDWQRIADDNGDQLGGALDLAAGQVLRIPSREGARVEESSFVVELAYERQRPAPGGFGVAGVALPRIDVDTVAAVWHLYLPRAMTPLHFRSNLNQASALRYDPWRRVEQFWDLVLGVDDAWAGDSYKNILSVRRKIWQAESDQKVGSGAVLSSFPLVGERYRFKRILLGKETPRIAVVYASRALEDVVRWGALLAAAAISWLLIRRRTPATVTAAVAGTLVLLVLGHLVLGVHRRLVWGADLALIASLLLLERERIGAGLGRLLGDPFGRPWVSLKNAAILLGVWVLLELALAYPLLWSSAALVLLLGLHLLRARRTATEVADV